MEIRKLTQSEKYDARMIAAIAFHQRDVDREKERAESLADTAEDWGAFDPDGRLMAHIIHHRFQYRLDGQWVAGGGIGAVSTLPEYRRRGAVRAIFSSLLAQARREGEVLSALYPFNHAFYRRFGYETIRWQDRYGFSPSVLCEYAFRGEAEQLREGEPTGEYAALYGRFAKAFNLMIRREDTKLPEEHLPGDWTKDRRFAYLLREGGKPVAYLVFRDVRSDPAAVLSVQDYAWDGGEGFRALLGFLARFSADYGRIEITLPACLQLTGVIHAPDAYAIRQEASCSYMLRVVNAQRALEVMKKSPGCDIRIRVEDDLIPENRGVWRVTESGAERTEGEADLEVSVQALSQLVSGGVSLQEALLREDVRLRSGREALESVFRKKPILVADHF